MRSFTPLNASLQSRQYLIMALRLWTVRLTLKNFGQLRHFCFLATGHLRAIHREGADTISSISVQGIITMTKRIPFLRRDHK